MIVSICEEYHDYEPKMFLIDTKKLDKDNFVDQEILKAIKEKQESCLIDASVWETDPKFKGSEPYISSQAIVKTGKASRQLMVIIDFDD